MRFQRLNNQPGALLYFAFDHLEIFKFEETTEELLTTIEEDKTTLLTNESELSTINSESKF